MIRFIFAIYTRFRFRHVPKDNLIGLIEFHFGGMFSRSIAVPCYTAGEASQVHYLREQYLKGIHTKESIIEWCTGHNIKYYSILPLPFREH